MTLSSDFETGSPSSGNTEPELVKPLLCARAAIEKKAEHTRILDLRDRSGFTDFFVVSSGTSDRQVRSIADSIAQTMTDAGFSLLSSEGYGDGRWTLLDFGDVVAHVFLDALRDYYDIEGLWTDAPRIPIPAEFYGAGASRLN